MDNSLTQTLSILGAVVGFLSAISVIVVALINKFGKGTSDRQTEVALGVSILEKQIDRADREKEKWTEIESFLREKLEKAEEDRDRYRKVLETAQEQIRVLTSERDTLLMRQKLLAAKFARGEAITLADITGQSLDNELEELEDTYSA